MNSDPRTQQGVQVSKTDVEDVCDALDCLYVLAHDMADSVHDRADRMYGAEPKESGSTSETPVRSGAIGQIEAKLKILHSELLKARAGVFRFGNLV